MIGSWTSRDKCQRTKYNALVTTILLNVFIFFIFFTCIGGFYKNSSFGSETRINVPINSGLLIQGLLPLEFSYEESL